MPCLFVPSVLLLLRLAIAHAAPQIELADGIFFEAEDYNGRPWYGDDGFGTKLEETAASGGAVLIGMYKPGALSYRLEIPQSGPYHVWMRCAAPGDVNLQFGVDARSESDLATAPVPATTTMEGLTDKGGYQWRNLGTVDLKQGENALVLGRGALRPDCFLLTRQKDFTPGDDFLARVRQAKEAPKGVLLPELRHDRRITRRPKWLTDGALRPAYAHFEWDKSNTPQSWAKMAAATGANCLVGVGEMPAGTLDGKLKAFAFRNNYDTAFKHPAGYKKDDYSWVKEFVDAGRAEGLKVVIYDGAFRTLDPLLVDNPEWRQQDAKGKPYGAGFGSWHSPYRAAYIERWVNVARQYGIDGIMVDMLFTAPSGGDYSPFTVQAFKEKFGVEPPRKADDRNLTWQRWIDFQTWTREEVMLDVTEALHAVAPEIACIWNQTVGWIFDGREYLSSRAGQCADGLLEEMGWEVSHGAFQHRPSAWPLQSAWQSLFLHCRTAPGYGQMWHLNGFYTQVNHEALSYSMFANGVAPAVVTGGNWQFMKQVWDHVKACEPYLSGASLVPYAALHFSENTLHWYANARGEDTRNAYLMNLFGIFQSLLETHLPVAFVTDDDIENAEVLSRYASVLLPNSACLSDAQAVALADYVQRGGGLVATLQTGMFDENGTRRSRAALEDLLAVKQGDVHEEGSWYLRTDQTHEIVNVPQVTEGGDPSQGSRERKPSINIFRDSTTRKAAVVKTTPASGVDSVPLGGPGPGYSLLHTRALGDGRAAYLPADIGHAYFTYNHPITRLVIERSVRWAATVPPLVETDAPMAVQTVCFQKGDNLVVHLVNDNSSFGRAAPPNPENFGAFRAEVVPIHNVTLTVKGMFSKAAALPQNVALAVVTADGKTRVTVPKLDIYSMVVLSH